MSIEEENKALVRRFDQLYNQRDFDACHELLAPEFVSHRTSGDVLREEVIQGNLMLYHSFPDINLNIDFMVAEGDMVVYWETWTGTHKGDFMGIPPTGKTVFMTNATTFRVANGKFAEAWVVLDAMNLMQQLGAIPSR